MSESTEPALFEDPDANVAAARDSPLVRFDVRSLPDELRLGTSSWSFPGWRGLVWNGDHDESTLANRGLAAYAGVPLLRGVGLDRAFYRPLARSVYDELRASVPPSFRFLVKTWSGITRRDERTFLDPEVMREQVVMPVTAGLGPTFGCLLIQFSPMGVRSRREATGLVRAIGRFVEALPVGPVYAIEPRDRLLLNADWAAMLRDVGAVHGFGLVPQMPTLREQAAIVRPSHGRMLVVRWLLHAGLDYDGAKERYQPFRELRDPDPSTRADLAALCRRAAEASMPAIVIANNKAEGSAPLTLLELARAITAQ